MAFADGDKTSKLEGGGHRRQRNTGTTVRFWPDAKYFDSPKFTVPKLKHNLRAKAVLCPGLRIRFVHEGDRRTTRSGSTRTASRTTCSTSSTASRWCPRRPSSATSRAATRRSTGRSPGCPRRGDLVTESYVNLIPTAQGGTHVNGFRAGLTEAIREFCEFRDLLPRGVKLAPEDVWARCSYVLSVRTEGPAVHRPDQGAALLARGRGLRLRGGPGRLRLWLNQHTEDAERIARLAIDSALRPAAAGQEGEAEDGHLRAGAARQARRLHARTSARPSCSWSRGTRPAARPSRRGAGSSRPSCRCGARSSTPGRSIPPRCWVAGGARHRRRPGGRPGSAELDGLRYGKVCILADADSDGAHIATLLCALFVRHFRPLVEAGQVYVAMPPLYRIDVGKEVFYALDEAEKKGILDRIEAEKLKGKVERPALQGPGRDEPAAAARDHHGPRDPPPGAARPRRRRRRRRDRSTCSSPRPAPPTARSG